MAYGILGNSPINRASTNYTYSFIELLVPSSHRGILKEAEVYIAIAGTIKIKIFRDDGTNYLFIGEKSVSVGTGLNTISCWIPVEKGDLIGFYLSGGGQIDAATSGGNAPYHAGDVTTNTLKSTWAAQAYIHSIQGKIFARVGIL